jgi:UDP-N-acetylmuramoyl-tripeptide--D-alanyl-D-alanine ligase
MATPIPRNRAAFDLTAILDATNGEVVVVGPDMTTSVSTDTRAIEPGACFVALRGDRHDGHAHLEAARDAGAVLAVVDRDVAPPAGMAVVRVADTLVALGDLARAHARRWRAQGEGRRLVGITGSAGKTTTRVAVTALLEETGASPDAVLSSTGNLNNRVGVPLVLFGLEPRHEVAVVEMGMNRPGEIAELCRIAEPEIGVITLIAAAHTEGLGSVDAVGTEKGALFRALPADGTAIGNADDRRVVMQLTHATARRRFRYGQTPEADRWISSRTPIGMTSSRVKVGEIEFTTPLLGEAGALACAAAITVAECALGRRATGEVCTRAFARADVGAGAGRLVPRVLANDVAVIDDTYNANPASSCASIQAAAEIARATGRRLLLVLGEMKELGPLSAQGHDEVGRAAASSGAEDVFAVGGGDATRIAARALEGGTRAVHAERVEDIAALLERAVRPGDLVLVKGSRSIGTERVVASLARAADRGQGSAA